MFQATVGFFYKGPTETHKAHGCQINNITTVNYQNQCYSSDSRHSACLFADMQTNNKKLYSTKTTTAREFFTNILLKDL